MPGGQHARAELPRCPQQLIELDRTVALDAGHRRLARGIAVGEAFDHRLAKPILIIEHVVRNADALGHETGIVDVLSGAAGALAMSGFAMIVKLQRDPDHVVAFRLQQRRRRRRVDAAGHGDNDAGVLRAAFKVEAVEHGSGLIWNHRAAFAAAAVEKRPLPAATPRTYRRGGSGAIARMAIHEPAQGNSCRWAKPGAAAGHRRPSATQVSI